jgi:hypothetical protein
LVYIAQLRLWERRASSILTEAPQMFTLIRLTCPFITKESALTRGAVYTALSCDTDTRETRVRALICVNLTLFLNALVW